jgi:hypothetical protein
MRDQRVVDTQCRCRWKDLKKRRDSRSRTLIQKANSGEPENLLEYLRDMVSPSSYEEFEMVLSMGVEAFFHNLCAESRPEPVVSDAELAADLPQMLPTIEKRSICRVSSSISIGEEKRETESRSCRVKRRKGSEESDHRMYPLPHPRQGSMHSSVELEATREDFDGIQMLGMEEHHSLPFLRLDIPSVQCEWEIISMLEERNDEVNDIE